ncbi:UrcA family protein [Caulobacter endophyticus]|uniref:UrcA family protein n=1 Tax=Caulobacter endophyticus TaxID=2172652 RepID=A0A2T9K4N6_9CAUL|nr:UrcA family protein [Caulobacter endophyticus]PVM90942.1 UrcA family protein [Caulobacter endophyticus]
MRKFMISLTTIATLTLAAVPLIGITQAAHAGERPVTVRVGDLNLANPADAAEFEARSSQAVQKFCRARASKERLDLLSRRACVIEVRAEINDKLSANQRKALASTGHQAPIAVAAY